MPNLPANAFPLCAVTSGKHRQGFQEIRKHSTVQRKKITNLAWHKHQTIN
ncbi:TPA: formate--tetrahydrofolate ligase [Klebsiella aerogenes]|nr:formate--tetrahydrofolate ligase [Klebsiella aerogenes]HCR0083448.1 formate--tetrahydrofolate ligase [Klebsiella aerogenes]HCR0511226.1 formate--tetrahydrofolate ligase [Klebsiella aerogenes]HDS5550658.1 formate--tetrahydrofolate ligase [Klebsiella aerogenes]HEO9966689.1 formate--tetrahydrofolate ligase [Klebsiella aerogenes]